jgi:hypothetical protein
MRTVEPSSGREVIAAYTQQLLEPVRRDFQDFG